MSVFQTLLGTNQNRFRIGLVGPTIYTGTPNPTVTPPTPVTDGFRDGDLYICTLSGAEAIWLLQSGTWVQVGVGGGSFVGDITMNPGTHIFGDSTATATDPSFTFNGDPNTGFYRSAVDEIGISTAGTQRFAVEADGTLSATTVSYETLVLSDNDIPNRKFVVDNFLAIAGDTMTGDLTFASSAQALLSNGTAANPSITFTSDLNTGLFYPAATGEIAISSNGTTVATFSPSGLELGIGNQVVGPNGTAAVPDYSFTGDLTTGVFGTGIAGQIGFSSGGSQTLLLDATTASGTLLWRGGDGVVATPAISFNSDPDTGFFWSSSGVVEYSSNGSSSFALDGTAIDGTVFWRGGDGTSGLPALSFNSDPDTGFFLLSSGTIGFSSNSFSSFAIDNIAIDGTVFWRGGDGSAVSPAMSFSSATDTGLFLSLGGVVISTGGTQKVSIESDGTLSVNTLGYESLVLANNDIPNKLYVDNRAHTGLINIWVPAKDMTPTTTAGCATLTQVELIAGQPELEVLDFDQSSDESAQFSIAIPNGWDKGSIFWQAYWTSVSATTDNVAWRLQAVAVADGDPIAVAYGSFAEVIDAAQGTANDLYVSAISDATPVAGTPTNNELVYFKITRNTATGTNLAADARLIGVKIFYTRDQGNDA